MPVKLNNNFDTTKCSRNTRRRLCVPTLLQGQESNSLSQDWTKRGTLETGWTSPQTSTAGQRKAQNIPTLWLQQESPGELICGCSDLLFVLKPGSQNLHFCNAFHTAKIRGHVLRPDLTGGSKHKSGSTRLPPSASAFPHCWHHTGIACSHCASQQEWTIERNRGDLAGAFKSARNCQEEEKLSIRGMWVLSWPSLTPQERGFTPLK